MRDFQRLLLVIGSAAFGASSLGLIALVYVAAQPSPPGMGGVGAAGLAIFLLGGSAALGALVGFVIALRRITTRESEPWTPTVWRGVAFGLLAGLLLYLIGGSAEAPPGAGGLANWLSLLTRPLSLRLPRWCMDVFDMIAFWPIAAVLAAALGLVGGVIANVTGSRRDRRGGDRLPRPEDPLPGIMPPERPGP